MHAGVGRVYFRDLIRTMSCQWRREDYLAFLEERSGVEIGCVSTGPERNQTIVRRGSRLEKLLG